MKYFISLIVGIVGQVILQDKIGLAGGLGVALIVASQAIWVAKGRS